MGDILIILAQIIGLYKWVLIARILLSWLPNLNWYDPPWRWLRDVTEPVMEPFRRLIPPIGMMDISPILLFILLDVVQRMLVMAALGGG